MMQPLTRSSSDWGYKNLDKANRSSLLVEGNTSAADLVTNRASNGRWEFIFSSRATVADITQAFIEVCLSVFDCKITMSEDKQTVFACKLTPGRRQSQTHEPPTSEIYAKILFVFASANDRVVHVRLNKNNAVAEEQGFWRGILGEFLSLQEKAVGGDGVVVEGVASK